MKRMLRKALAVLLSVIMAGSVCMIGVSADGTAPEQDTTEKGDS